MRSLANRRFGFSDVFQELGPLTTAIGLFSAISVNIVGLLSYFPRPMLFFVDATFLTSHLLEFGLFLAISSLIVRYFFSRIAFLFQMARHENWAGNLRKKKSFVRRYFRIFLILGNRLSGPQILILRTAFLSFLFTFFYLGAWGFLLFWGFSLLWFPIAFSAIIFAKPSRKLEMDGSGTERFSLRNSRKSVYSGFVLLILLCSGCLGVLRMKVNFDEFLVLELRGEGQMHGNLLGSTSSGIFFAEDGIIHFVSSGVGYSISRSKGLPNP